MPVCSYLVHSQPGRRTDVANRLEQIPGCEATPADQHDLIVLVTATDTVEEEAALQKSLESVEGIQNIALTFGDVSQEATSDA